jgi:cytochrome c peroxidase
MASDIKNASARLILSKSIYSGEETLSPLMLARIEGAIRSNSMPPHLYLSMHWAGRLKADEKQSLLNWIAEEREKSPLSEDSTKALKAEPVQPLPLQVTVDPKKIALGDELFHDTSLSGDNTLSCASCHGLNKGGTDQAKVATGIRGRRLFTMSAIIWLNFGMVGLKIYKHKPQVPLLIRVKWVRNGMK